MNFSRVFGRILDKIIVEVVHGSELDSPCCDKTGKVYLLESQKGKEIFHLGKTGKGYLGMICIFLEVT